MSATNIQAYTKKTLSKALYWLEQQPKDWARHIHPNTAVRLYLKVQEKEKKKENPFVKELKKYCNEGALTEEEAPKKIDLKEDKAEPKVLSQPDEQIETASLSAQALKREESLDFSLLDSKSKDFLLKTKEGLNLSSSEEALRVLIQVGYKSLKSQLHEQ